MKAKNQKEGISVTMKREFDALMRLEKGKCFIKITLDLGVGQMTTTECKFNHIYITFKKLSNTKLFGTVLYFFY